MHLTSIFLLLVLCASIGTVSSLSWNGLVSTVLGWLGLSDPINKIKTETCSYFANHPDRANETFIKINQALQSKNTTQQMFATTLAYINDPVNQLKLVSNTTACPMFIDEFINALVTDYQNARANTQTARQNAVNKLKELYTTYKLW
ncbi:unnamed protein product [Rotaria sp. Silwood1]|nr:unnamed protein product [Rotaria sp. Silwood1]CAF1321253.1 unnamed protein product [Rotaria sp. Silwood1]CAF3487201.1 unnamed protein product [Rotaria sp. Silwood1]CAF3487214.1 unnamed protein product [Rotaria sp. Silwood1]CAF4915829.1 unnamed protein product [Rotaria sp. Silwood1]